MWDDDVVVVFCARAILVVVFGESGRVLVGGGVLCGGGDVGSSFDHGPAGRASSPVGVGGRFVDGGCGVDRGLGLSRDSLGELAGLALARLALAGLIGPPWSVIIPRQ